VPIQYFDQSQAAFNLFVAIYAEKAPNETAQLMKYAETIRKLAKKVPGKTWLYYDEQFRELQSMPISQCSTVNAN